MSVLIVEDDALIAMETEAILTELGWPDIVWAHDIASAEAALANGTPAFSVLDVNLGRALVFPIADILRRRGAPFVFSTAMSARDLPAEWASYPLANKPIAARALHDILARLTAPGDQKIA